jgi:hypothetical protein
LIVLAGVEDDMKREHHTPEHIILNIRLAVRLSGGGSSMVEAYRHLEVTEQTYYR